MALFHVLICVAVMGSDADDVINYAKEISQRRQDQYRARAEKQVLVHLAPSGVKIFTPNRRSEDKDLVDRVPPANELAIVCDGVEQSTIDGKQAWKCIGNVRLHATKVVVFCHEVTVTQDAEFLHFDIAGGWDSSSVPPVMEEPTVVDGNAFVASERGSDQPYRFEGAISFHAGQMKQKLDTGAYQIIIKSEIPKGPRI